MKKVKKKGKKEKKNSQDIAYSGDSLLISSFSSCVLKTRSTRWCFFFVPINGIAIHANNALTINFAILI
jgi:hypothetical protein